MNSDREKLAERLALLAKDAGSPTALARICGFPQRTMAGWVKGSREPKLSDAAQIAVRMGVRLEWIATGEGPQRFENEPYKEDSQTLSTDAGQLMPDLLENVITGVEIFISSRGLPIQADRKARLITTLYRIMARRRAARTEAGQPFPEDRSGHPIHIDGDPDLLDIVRMAT